VAGVGHPLNLIRHTADPQRNLTLSKAGGASRVVQPPWVTHEVLSQAHDAFAPHRLVVQHRTLFTWNRDLNVVAHGFGGFRLTDSDDEAAGALVVVVEEINVLPHNRIFVQKLTQCNLVLACNFVEKDRLGNGAWRKMSVET